MYPPAMYDATAACQCRVPMITASLCGSRTKVVAKRGFFVVTGNKDDGSQFPNQQSQASSLQAQA